MEQSKSTVNDSDGLKNFVIWHVSYHDFNLPPVPFAGFDIFKMQDLPLNSEFVMVAVSYKKRKERAKTLNCTCNHYYYNCLYSSL